MEIIHFSLIIMAMAFLCEYVDSSLGMGYGTTLTPLLLIMGYQPLEIVPAILLSELISGLSSAFFHHQFKNSDFRLGGRDLRIALVMAACSIVGTLAAVFVAVSLSKFYIKLYIGLVVLGMGIIILATLKREFKFSWKKITSLGMLAAFNKGISGGGYGPVVTSGQILSGVNSKSAIGITSLAEGLTCLVGVISYVLISGQQVRWHLAPSLALGAILSVPLAAYTVKRFPAKKIKLLVGVATLVLGIVTLGKVFL